MLCVILLNEIRYSIHIARVRLLTHITTFRCANSIQFIEIGVATMKRWSEIVPIFDKRGLRYELQTPFRSSKV